jgi:serine/threonine protein kinase
LIDFGVVKQLASRLQGDATEIAMVKVGKPGYSPVEQLRNGQAYPNSDLYSLAVTALVMLTGHPPTDLFQQEQINWAWRNWVNISDGLANVLGKMLSYQPSDRYQSAVEVFQALQSLSIPTDRVSQSQPTATAQLPDMMLPDGSTRRQRSQTVAQKVYTVLTQFDAKSMWEQPRVYIPLFFAMAFISFAAGLVAMTVWQNHSETSTNPSTSPTIASDTLVSPSFSDAMVKPPNTITLSASETTVLSGQVRADRQIDYEFYGTQGQTIALTIDNPKLLITVLGPNGLAVDTQAIRAPSWQGNITATGKHIVQIKSIPGATGEPFDYRLSAQLVSPTVNPAPSSNLISPSIAPTAAPLPNPLQDLPLTNPTSAAPLPPPVPIPSSRAIPQSPAAPNQTEEQPSPNPSENRPFYIRPRPLFIKPSTDNPNPTTNPENQSPQPPAENGTPAPATPPTLDTPQ